MTSPLPPTETAVEGVVPPLPYLHCIDSVLRVSQFQAHPAEVNALLDFRRAVLDPGMTAEGLLDVFCRCRRQAEASLYLQFYRLRTLMEQHLRVEARDRLDRFPARQCSLQMVWKSPQGLYRSYRQAYFEHSMEPVRYEDIEVRIIPVNR